MPVGDAGKEQFRDAIMELRNTHIISAMAPLFDFRSEVTGNEEFKVRGGLDTTTQQHLMKHLQNADKWRRCITYNPNREELDERIKKAISTTNLITGSNTSGQPPADPLKTDPQPFGGDEVQGAPARERQLPWALDGSNPNIPLNSALNFRSNTGMLLLQAIDNAIVNWTRLESRFNGRFITVDDSMRMYQDYVQILEYLKIFGGDQNTVPFAAGVLPTEEPRGAESAPNMIGEVAGASGIAATVKA